MNKEKIVDFFKRISVQGRVQKFKFVVDDEGVMTVITKPESPNFHVTAKLSGCTDFPAGTYGLNNVQDLISMLSVMDDNSVVSLRNVNPYPVLSISDGDSNGLFNLADVRHIQNVEPQKYEPSYSFTLPLSKPFIDKYVKMRNALKTDSDNVAIFTVNNDVNIVINYSPNLPSNQFDMTFDVEHVESQIENAVEFPSQIIKDIFIVNKSFDVGILKVSPEGLMAISYSTEDIDIKYLILKQSNNS